MERTSFTERAYSGTEGFAIILKGLAIQLFISLFTYNYVQLFGRDLDEQKAVLKFNMTATFLFFLSCAFCDALPRTKVAFLRRLAVCEKPSGRRKVLALVLTFITSASIVTCLFLFVKLISPIFWAFLNFSNDSL
ncbi:hypothetical protein PFISCL1PPCAC_11826, partial [Pristionchus fissidentatus]